MIFNRTPWVGIALPLSVAGLAVAAGAQTPWAVADPPGLGAPRIHAEFAAQLAQARADLANSWTATAEMVGQTSNSVRLVYEAGPATPSGRASVESIALDHLRGLNRSCTVGIPPDSEVEMEVVEARVAARVNAPEAAELFAGMAHGPVELGERGLLRRQEVVALGFGPRLDGEELIVFDRIEVELRFSSPSTSKRRSRADRWGEVLYRNTLVNYEQAKSWRLPAIGPAAGKMADGSALNGEMLRVTVRKNGMYKVTGADLVDAGIALQTIDPEHLRMLYGGGRVLGLQRAVIPGFYRREIPFVVEDGGDGRFDAGDFLLFYGEATQRWDYHRGDGRYFWQANPFTEDNVYFLDTGAEVEGRRMRQSSGSRDHGSPRLVDSYRQRLHLEDDRLIRNQSFGIKSGYDWYWEDFGGNARNYSAIVRDAVSGIPVDIRVRFWGSRREIHRFDLYWNEELVGEVSMDSMFVATLKAQAPQGAKEGLNQLGVFHRDDKATRLDWIELEFDRRLSAEGGELAFAWPPSAISGEGDGVTAEFVLTGFAEEGKPRIFEISAIDEASEIVGFDYDEITGTAVFQDRFDGRGVPPRYIASVPSRWKRPAKMELDTPSRLRTPDNGAEYVVLTHADFRAAADRLAAWRAADDRFGPMRTISVDVQHVYDEFSGGLLDPMAIRSFVNYAVDNWDPAPYFVCLIGDGTYDYKNNTGTSYPNWMPAYQEGISMFDEWYVRVEGEDRIPDLAIGRLAVQTAAEAEGVVDKLIAYDADPEVGPWQSRVLLVADDLRHPSNLELKESYFIRDAESLARYHLPSDLDLVKLYLAQFQLEGSTKPQAREEFLRRFNEGALIVTYIGHGSFNVLAHESMFLLSRDADKIDNGRRLPFMYTAASQVGVFDKPDQQSIPEVLMNRPDGGVIGFISAARVGYHVSNMYLAREFHRLMYRSEEDHIPLGLALTIAKQNVTGDKDDRTNMQRYCLIGDPAMRLARPRYAVALEVPDSMRALEEIRVAGRILDSERGPVEDFTGTALVQAFDSSTKGKLDHITYTRLGAPIFRGWVEVAAGRFETAFRVPKDISYKEDKGRVSAYVWSDDAPAAFGAVDSLVLAGTASGVAADETGPEIRVRFKGQDGFSSGDFVPGEAVLEAVINDQNGINITGETGHEMELRVDDRLFIVTEFFHNTGDYRRGLLEFPLPAMEPGTHTLRLKAWDTFNNSSQVEAEMRVSEGDDSGLSQLLFHPNPMRDGGDFTYTLEIAAEYVHIRVFSLAGRLVDELSGTGNADFNQVAWTPPSELANGTYLYQVEVELADGRRVERKAAIQVMK